MIGVFLATALALVFIALLCSYRVFAGPTISDRVIAVNVIGTKTLVVLVLVAYIYGQKMFIDISLTYAMLNFLIIIIAAMYLETGRVV